MENPTYIECSFQTDTAHCDALILELHKHGIDSFSIEDYSDLLEYTASYPPELVDDSLLAKQNASVTIRCYFEPDAFQPELLKGIEAATGAKLETQNVAQEDWANNWKKYFKPRRVGKNLVVKPSWEDYAATESDVVVEIDPGMAFGTGTHETTMLCLQALEKEISRFEAPDVLDVGCGSGILAIAALKLGAKNAVGVDFDPLAVAASRENARINGVSGQICIKNGNLVDKIQEKYDIILVNIVADAIIELTGQIEPFIKPDGICIASGILFSRLPEVKNAFERAGFVIAGEERVKDWAALVARYPGEKTK